MEMKEREAVHDQTEQVQDDGAAKYMKEERLLCRALGKPRSKRKDGCDAYEEEKSWKDQVCGSEAIPCSMLERPIRLSLAAVIVDEDHERDREAT
jgi:hypothetical protein